MSTLARSSPLVEAGYASPAMASILSGFRPFEVRNLISQFDPILDHVPIVRSVRVRGRLLVRLADWLAIASVHAGGRTP
jgi:hypothetical protein